MAVHSSCIRCGSLTRFYGKSLDRASKFKLVGRRFHPQVFPVDSLFVLAANLIDGCDKGLVGTQAADFVPKFICAG